MTSVSVITPWLNHPELITAYERSCQGAQIVIIDNASEPFAAEMIHDMVVRMGGEYIRNESNKGFAEANNQGLERAKGDIVLFMNNDIEAAANFIGSVGESVGQHELCGPSLLVRWIDGIAVPYLEGWCLAGTRQLVAEIGGWNSDAFPGLYYEDNEFCWRAMRAGASLVQRTWPVRHLSNYTTSKTPGAYDNSERNRQVFEEIVRRERERITANAR